MELMKKSGDIRIVLLFIRNLYLLAALQSLLSVAVGTIVVLVAGIPKFLLTTTPGIVLYVLTLLAPFAVMITLIRFRHRPVNDVLPMLYCVLSAFAFGLSCSLPYLGKCLWSAGILTSVVFITLTLYTSWASARGHDFSFLGPFLMVSLFVLIVFALFKIFTPFGKLVLPISQLLMTIVLSGFIIYYSNNLIKQCYPSPQHCEPLPGMLGMSGGQ